MNKQKGNFFLLPNKIFEEGSDADGIYGVWFSHKQRRRQRAEFLFSAEHFPKPAVCVRTPAVRQSKDLQKKAMLMFRKDTLITQGQSNLYTVLKL